MSSHRLETIATLALLAIGGALSGCATGGSAGGAKGDPRFWGTAGDRLVQVDPAAGGSSVLGRSRAGEPAAMADVGALAYDPVRGIIYGVADATSEPWLITLDRSSGAAVRVGAITLPDLELNRVEALAVAPDGRLLAAGGRSEFASNLLLEIDPATGEATRIAQVSGTDQSDIDAMTFAHGALFAVDNAGNSGRLYLLDAKTGQAKVLGTDLGVAIHDLAFDPQTGILYGTVVETGELVTVPQAGGPAKVLGPVAAASAPLGALAIAPPAGTLFGDGFESGSLALWSVSEGGTP